LESTLSELNETGVKYKLSEFDPLDIENRVEAFHNNDMEALAQFSEPEFESN
jgi:hypothetical protein